MTETSTRDRHILNYTDKTITVGGWLYQFGALPETLQLHFGMAAAAQYLSRQTDPQAAFEKLRAGTHSLIKAEKTPKVDTWRQAPANVHARMSLRASGIKAPPGKRLDDSAEFADLAGKALAASAAWGREELARAKKHADVVAEHRKLTGATDDLGSLFAPAASTPPVVEVADEFAVAAE